VCCRLPLVLIDIPPPPSPPLHPPPPSPLSTPPPQELYRPGNDGAEGAWVIDLTTGMAVAAVYKCPFTERTVCHTYLEDESVKELQAKVVVVIRTVFCEIRSQP
jgi:hypothetical protein